MLLIKAKIGIIQSKIYDTIKNKTNYFVTLSISKQLIMWEKYKD